MPSSRVNKTTKILKDAKLSAIQFGTLGLILVTIAACTLIGHQAFYLVQDANLTRIFLEVTSAIGSALSMFRLNGMVAAALIPGLIVSGLSIGGIYVWNRRA